MAPQFYEVLGVSWDASDATIRSAYRKRALATHPDKGGHSDVFLLVVEAFEVLSDLKTALGSLSTTVKSKDYSGII